MDAEIQALEEQLQILRDEEQQLIKEAKIIKQKRRKDLLKEIDQLQRSNQKRRTEIKTWKETSTTKNNTSEPTRQPTLREVAQPKEITLATRGIANMADQKTFNKSITNGRTINTLCLANALPNTNTCSFHTTVTKGYPTFSPTPNIITR